MSGVVEHATRLAIQFPPREHMVFQFLIVELGGTRMTAKKRAMSGGSWLDISLLPIRLDSVGLGCESPFLALLLTHFNHMKAQSDHFAMSTWLPIPRSPG